MGAHIMSLEYRLGDVRDRLAEIPDGSIDLICTSPPFLALRSYLPSDHPDKAKEIGSESTPAAFIDTLLALTAEFGRVLAPHGSLCVELGDTYSGTNPKAALDATEWTDDALGVGRGNKSTGGQGWPLAKSLTGIPTLYPWSLAYGRNLLTGQESPAGRWRIRNVIVWARPNPPVGALGDKFRPATSYITVACQGAKRFFDLDAVRTPYMESTLKQHGPEAEARRGGGSSHGEKCATTRGLTHGALTNAGAPPLDWHTDQHPEDGDWLWKLSTQPYKGAHYATFPLELPTRLIRAMCPLRVCTICGKPSERITEQTAEYVTYRAEKNAQAKAEAGSRANAARGRDGGEVADDTFSGWSNTDDSAARGQRTTTVGWTDCGCYSVPSFGDHWRTGVVLDPFAGSGTTLEAAQNVGRHAIGIDLDPRNADLASSRVGMFMTTHT